MENVVIRKNGENYEMIVNDEVTILTTYKGEPYTLVLPENPSNRKYFNSKKVDLAGGEITLTYKETRTIGPRSGKKDWTEYLTDEERTVIESIKARCEERKAADVKSPEELEKEKLLRQLARLQAQYDALLNK